MGFRIRRSDSSARRRGPHHSFARDLAGAISGDCATRRGRDGTGGGFKSRATGRESGSSSSWRGSSTNPWSWSTKSRSRLMATAGRRSRSTSPTRSTGKTSFVLGVDARAPDDRDGGRFSQSLAGKQDWYGVQGGIWKPARLEARDPVHLSELAVRSSYDLAEGTRRRQRERSPQPWRPKSALTLSRSGETVAQREMTLRSTEFEAALEAVQSRRMVAGRAQPLRLAVELSAMGRRARRGRTHVGFRQLEAKDGRLVLNGRALLHVRRARSGLASRGRVPARRARSFSSSASPTPRRWGSTRCAATSRFPTGSISISPTGSA